MNFVAQASAVGALAVYATCIHANTVDFDNLNDGDPVTNQYAYATFANTIALSAGISLNEFEFPPHSGTNVASDFGGPIQIDFSVPVSMFSAYFTYLEPLTLTAFDAANAAVGSATSAFSSNLALSGDPGSSPNELLAIAFASGISHITILGDPGGGSFTMDDVTFAPIGTSAVPEPSTFLILSVLLALILRRGLCAKRTG
jgi:hypothetical protein